MNGSTTERRWDTDVIGHGVVDGTLFAPGVQQLLGALHIPKWVAEAPDEHLLPHLRRTCESMDAPWSIGATHVIDGVYEVTLEWTRPEGNLALLRADIFALVGAIAEGTTFVQQRIMPDRLAFEVITGLLEGETHFRSHGHLVRFHVEGAAATRILAREQVDQT